MKGTILLVCLLFLSSALCVSADSSADFTAAVKSVSKDFEDAIKAKDAAKIGMLYAQDAIVFPPNGEMVKGREAIQAFWKGFIDGNMTAQVETVETEAQGNLGVEVGKYTIMDSSGKTVDQGKYVVTWKKGSDGWKLYRDIWNTNMPGPTAAQ